LGRASTLARVSQSECFDPEVLRPIVRASTPKTALEVVTVVRLPAR
jgi:hypothetical protein